MRVCCVLCAVCCAVRVRVRVRVAECIGASSLPAGFSIHCRQPSSPSRRNVLLIAFVNLRSIRKRFCRAFDARFAQQMQDRIRRAVRVILDIVRFAAFELIARVKARNLQRAFEPQLLQHPVREEQAVR